MQLAEVLCGSGVQFVSRKAAKIKKDLAKPLKVAYAYA